MLHVFKNHFQAMPMKCKANQTEQTCYALCENIIVLNTDYSLASVIPPPLIANVASFSGRSGLQIKKETRICSRHGNCTPIGVYTRQLSSQHAPRYIQYAPRL